MKQRYDIEIGGVKLSIVSSDGAEFVEKTVAEFESSVQSVLRVGKNYSRLDAIILSALDYCGEYRKAEDKIRNLEAQIEILEARVQKDTEAPAKTAKVSAKSEKTPASKDKPAADDIADAIAEIAQIADADETVKTEETAESAAKAVTDTTDDSDDDGTDDSFRELEAFLGTQLSLGFGEE